jgi:CRP/FNR family transcriptional regulator
MQDKLSTDELAVLKRSPMFSSLNDEAAGQIVSAARVLRRPAGARVCGPGENAECFFVVLSGRVKIYMISPKGDQQILHIFGPGNSFAEAAMWAGSNYPAFAESLSDVSLLAVSRSVLLRAFTREPELALGMLAGMAEKLREFSRLIEGLSLKDVTSRLATALLAEAQETGGSSFTLSLPKRQMAAQIGTTPETLSRSLAQLKRAGVIDVQGPTITVLSYDRLAGLAEGLDPPLAE